MRHLIVCAVLFSGCIENKMAEQEQKVASLEARLQVVQQDLRHLDTELDKMEADLARLIKICKPAEKPD
jgi:CII-binding regulator of phage lambda lysogenization HflD